MKNKCFFFAGVFACLADGLVFPTIGVCLAKIVISELKLAENPDYHKNQVQIYYFVALGLAFLGTITNTLAQTFFGLLGKDSVR